MVAFRQINHARLEVKLDHARAKADRTSSAFRDGARGLKARKAFIAAEKEVEESKAKLDVDLNQISPEELSTETQGAVDMLSEVQAALDLVSVLAHPSVSPNVCKMDSAAAESQARTILAGLGFSSEKIDGPMSQLSGGWKTRCRIACSLSQRPDILLLDEPTNFLDLPSIIWLQNYVIGLEGTTVVVVTHDRDFADAVAEELIVLRNQKLEKFRGNLSAYESVRHANFKYMSRMKDAQDKQKKHMESTIRSNIRAAKRTGDDKKLKQAASRQKKLDERMGMEVSAKGTRFKLNDQAGFFNTNKADIVVPDFDPPVKLNLPTAVADLRFPGALLNVEKLSFAYPGKKRIPILHEINMTIHPGERVGLCGLNGSGKSTLVSLVMGATEGIGGLKPTTGNITRHSRARFAQFTQEAVEELEAVAVREPQTTALSHILSCSGGSLDEGEARGLLGGIGLQGQTAANTRLVALSGGQKVRLALAVVLLNPPHLLILDEVTTHLDADTILALIIALRDYEGAILVVTHDRFFMKCAIEGENPYKVAKRIGVEDEDDEEEDSSDEEADAKKGRVYRMFKGTLRHLERGMAQYEEIAARASSRLGKVKG